MKTKNKKDHSVLVASVATVLLLFIVIGVFLTIRGKDNEKNSILEEEEARFENITFDITYTKPQNTFNAIRNDQFLIIDTRSEDEFSEYHIESSLNIPLETLWENRKNLDKNKTLIIVEKQENQDGKKMAEKLTENDFKLNYLEGGLYNYLGVGYDLVSSGDISSAQDRAKVNLIDLSTLGQRLNDGERFTYLDVREKSAYDADHFANSVNIPLESLERDKNSIPVGKIIIIDENPTRSFQAAVRLSDMHFVNTHYLTNKYSEFKEAVKNKTLLNGQAPQEN